MRSIIFYLWAYQTMAASFAIKDNSLEKEKVRREISRSSSRISNPLFGIDANLKDLFIEKTDELPDSSES